MDRLPRGPPSECDAEEVEEDVVVLGKLDREQWAVVLRNDARGKLLEVARSGDWQTVVNFLIRLAALDGPAPPLLGRDARKVSLSICSTRIRTRFISQSSIIHFTGLFPQLALSYVMCYN